jgi:hypothetical protein
MAWLVGAATIVVTLALAVSTLRGGAVIEMQVEQAEDEAAA